MADFSQLPFDVLELVASFLPLQAYYRFGAVCRVWFSVVKERRLSPATQLPWLILSDNTRTSRRRIFSLPEQKHYSIDIPDFSGLHFCGSSHGWFIAANKEMEYHLLNPFSRDKIQTPVLLPHYELLPPGPNELDEPIDRLYYLNLFMDKVILSADPSKYPDYAVMALVGPMKKLAFWRPNDTKWTKLMTRGQGDFEAILWYEGHFHALNSYNDVVKVDIDRRQVTKVTNLNTCRGPFRRKYLVDMFGYLVVVFREIDPGGDEPIKTGLFVVFKFDEAKKRWVELAGIGNCALFLGRNDSVAVRASEFPGCKENCIYFTEDYFTGPSSAFGDMGIYSLADGSIEPLFSNPLGFLPALTPPVWLNPSPRSPRSHLLRIQLQGLRTSQGIMGLGG